jgi:hypothetical protein
MRIAWWSIVGWGMAGALLWAGPGGAQPFPGGLPACVRQLNTCNTNLETCQTDLGACQVFPGDGVDGPMLSYTDNGDGTFTDNNTLFMWEKKDTSGGIHDVNRMFTWSNTATAADGTAFTVFLATLNTAPCFAGHCD